MNLSSKSRKVLIVNGQITDCYGTGIFLSNIFYSWSADQLVSISAGLYPVHKEKPVSHYCLKKQVKFSNITPFTSNFDKNKRKTISHSIGVILYKVRLLVRNTLKKGFNILLYLIGGRDNFRRVNISKELQEAILDFQPDVIYAGISDLYTLKIVQKIKQIMDLPIVLHIMDDWSSTLYNSGPAKYITRPKYLSKYANVITQCDVLIAISHEMAIEYEKRYNREVISFPVPANLTSFADIYRNQWSLGKSFVIRYGGRVGWAVREGLSDIAKIVDKLYKNGYDIVFEISTNQIEEIPKLCQELECVNIIKLSPTHQLATVNSQCDINFICLDFDDYASTQAKFSMPSKLPACMASASPILVYAPHDSPIVKYAMEYKWGAVVSKRSLELLEKEIRILLNSKSIRESYGRKARDLAFQYHDAEVISRNFSDVINGLF